ncbi:hypothetical protein AAVH_11871 [Aphelenchoides avenae]|nr:hypothetical protein AAVH_11871 [Aphelenchus avenae]
MGDHGAQAAAAATASTVLPYGGRGPVKDSASRLRVGCGRTIPTHTGEKALSGGPCGAAQVHAVGRPSGPDRRWGTGEANTLVP